MNKASRIRLAKQLLHCARMVLDAAQVKKTKSDRAKTILQMMRFVWDKLHNPSQTSGCKYTDHKYQNYMDEKVDWHHITGFFNKEPNDTLRSNYSALQEIVKKLSPKTLSIKQIQDSNDFSESQIKLIDEIYSLRQMHPLLHMKQHQRLKKVSKGEWDDVIISSLSYPNIRDFFEVIKQAMITFHIPSGKLNQFKQDIVNYLLKWNKGKR